MNAKTSPNRPLFVATIFAGSFLLFLVQPMVARMALPRLGGAPNVWNSAMLVYQALLLAGYAYAHRLSRMPLRRQAGLHLVLLAVAALTLPIALVNLPPPAPGSEVWWVPLLFLGTVGPVFFLVSAQAPLMQRWYSADPDAGEPWALYAASNLGSFAGLIAYPLLAEPLLRIHAQSLLWSVGYGLLFVLIALAARARWQAPDVVEASGGSDADDAPIPARRFLHWIALAAVPSGLLLSTTTHLTTDIFAMPLLWVIPLAVYLLSFVIAFSERRVLADLIARIAPVLLLLSGSMAMNSRGAGLFGLALGSISLLFVVAVSLHARMYALRPATSRLTLFYLAMSVGGALGGLFTALFAPLVFDWVWEHPLLVIAAAMLMPLPPLLKWHLSPGIEPNMVRMSALIIFLAIAVIAYLVIGLPSLQEPTPTRAALTLAMALLGLLLLPWRWLFVPALLVMMLAQGGLDTLTTSLYGARSRSYFGIYTVRDYPDRNIRTLAHGTTLHGQQSLDPARLREPMTYYGPTSGAALGLSQASALYGTEARVGVVGLGAGTLSCAKQPGQQWRFFEIDPAVLRYSRDGTFTYVSRCAPDAKVIIGDARLELARMPSRSLDVLAVDAFSSDAIPLHLLTDEAFRVYFDVLGPRGLLLVHISNRYIELEPVLAAIGRKQGLAFAKRDDNPADRIYVTPSTWVAMSRDPAVIAEIGRARPDAPWTPLLAPAAQVWSDDHASILPFVRWGNLFKTP